MAGENRKFDSCGNRVMKSPWGTAKTLKETMMEAEFNHLNHATWECCVKKMREHRAV